MFVIFFHTKEEWIIPREPSGVPSQMSKVGWLCPSLPLLSRELSSTFITRLKGIWKFSPPICLLEKTLIWRGKSLFESTLRRTFPFWFSNLNSKNSIKFGGLTVRLESFLYEWDFPCTTSFGTWLWETPCLFWEDDMKPLVNQKMALPNELFLYLQRSSWSHLQLTEILYGL